MSLYNWIESRTSTVYNWIESRTSTVYNRIKEIAKQVLLWAATPYPGQKVLGIFGVDPVKDYNAIIDECKKGPKADLQIIKNHSKLWPADFIVDDIETPINIALKNNVPLEIIQFFIDEGANVNRKDGKGNTPLHYASLQNVDPEIVRLLIKHDGDVNAKNIEGQKPLHFATKQHMHNTSFETIGCLLQNGAAVNDEDDAGNTALCLLCETFVRQHNNNQPWKTDYDMRPKIVELFLQYGAKVYAMNKYGWTPISMEIYWYYQTRKPIAYSNRTTQPEHDLMLSNMLLNMLINMQTSCLDHIKQFVAALYPPNASSPNVSLTQLTDQETKQAQQRLLHLATELNSIEVLNILLQIGVSVNTKDGDLNTPLHIAIKLGAIKISKFLLDKGADAKATGQYGQTPLDLAKRQEHISLQTKHSLLLMMLDSLYAPISTALASAKTIKRLGKNSPVNLWPSEIIKRVSECLPWLPPEDNKQQELLTLYRTLKPTITAQDVTQGAEVPALASFQPR